MQGLGKYLCDSVNVMQGLGKYLCDSVNVMQGWRSTFVIL